MGDVGYEMGGQRLQTTPAFARPAVAGPARRRRYSRRFVRQALAGYGFLLPALILYATFVLYPMANTVYYSLTSWDGAKPYKTWVGLANYLAFFKDDRALASLQHNVGWLVVGTAVPIVLGLALAVLMAGRTPGRLAFRTIYFMPAILPLVVVGIIWSWIYDPTYGILNQMLSAVGLSSLAHAWIAEPDTAQWATIFTGAWTWFGMCTTMFMAGLQNVDQELYDAALIDGANAWQRFWFVTIPQLSHVITMVTTLTLIGGFKVFDIVFVMTMGGPGGATEVISTYIYRTAFRFYEFGYASAMSVILTALVLVTSFLFLRISDRGGES